VGTQHSYSSDIHLLDALAASLDHGLAAERRRLPSDGVHHAGLAYAARDETSAAMTTVGSAATRTTRWVVSKPNSQSLSWVVVIVVAAVTAGMIAWGTRHGANLTPDSANYVSGARNIAGGRGYVNFQLQPITLFPPAFSALLALGQMVGVGAIGAARVLNACAGAAFVVLVFVLARRHVSRLPVAVGAAAGAGAGAPMFYVLGSVWTDGLFCVVAVSTVLVLEDIWKSHAQSWRRLIVCGALCTVGFSLRYAGVALIITAICITATAAAPRGMVDTFQRTATVAGVAAVGPLVTVVMNAPHGSIFGPRVPAHQSIWTVGSDAVDTLRGWVADPSLASTTTATVAAWVILAILLLGAGALLAGRRLRSVVQDLVPLVVYAIVYAGVLIYTEMSALINPVGTRLMSPLLAPMVVLVAVAVDAILSFASDSPAARPLAYVAALLVFAWVVSTISVSARNARGNAAAKDGYVGSLWIAPSLAPLIRALPADAVIATNEVYGTYFLHEREPVLSLPATQSQQSVHAFGAAISRFTVPVYLIWNYRIHWSGFASPDEIRSDGLQLIPVSVQPRGAIYRVAKPA
jgi:hypothetical protein